MLGDVGGLQYVLWIAVGIFAEYFSAKFYAQSIAKSLYLRTRAKDEVERYYGTDEVSKLKSMFKEIEISSF